MEINQVLSPAQNELQTFIEAFGQQLPYIGSGLALVLLFVLVAGVIKRITRAVGKHFIENQLILNVLSKLSGIIFVLLGVYLGLKVSGLSQLAATILGGTGLVGLIFGFAFRDIAENFLASILLTVHRPFSIGDVVQIEGEYGIVERMTIRCTVLMNFDGDHIQIPNGVVFKSKIKNITANPNQRSSFTVGVGFDASLKQVKQIIRKVLEEHPSVLSKPSYRVLIDELGSATVNVKVLYWVDLSKDDSLNVRSSVIHLTKMRLEQAGVSMPDEAREIIFPNGVPVIMQDAENTSALISEQKAEDSSNDKDDIDVDIDEIEIQSKNEQEEIIQQLKQSSSPESGDNIL